MPGLPSLTRPCSPNEVIVTRDEFQETTTGNSSGKINPAKMFASLTGEIGHPCILTEWLVESLSSFMPDPFLAAYPLPIRECEAELSCFPRMLTDL